MIFKTSLTGAVLSLGMFAGAAQGQDVALDAPKPHDNEPPITLEELFDDGRDPQLNPLHPDSDPYCPILPPSNFPS